MSRAEFDELAETFGFLDDWEERYRHVIELGKAMPAMDESLKTPGSKVDGCASQVWLVPKIEGQGPEARFDFIGDSDAMIVKGLIAVLHVLYAGEKLADLANIDARAELARLSLEENLSSQRSNGLKAMIRRIAGFAG